MSQVKITFDAPTDYDAAASVYGELLMERGYKPPPSLQMYVLEEDVSELERRLASEGIPFSRVEGE